MLSLRTHNILDYAIGAILIICPYIFAFSDITAATNVFLILGFGLIGYSLLTNYYYSIFKVIPVGVHMAMDVILGIVLIAAPSLFGYRTAVTGGQYALHWVMGLAAIALATFTQPRARATIREEMEVEQERPRRTA